MSDTTTPPSGYVCPQCGPDPAGSDRHTETHHTWHGDNLAELATAANHAVAAVRAERDDALAELATVKAERDEAAKVRDHWLGLAMEPPEPCPLDHHCDSEESPCCCWCPLHDCRLDDCPTFTTVLAWLEAERSKIAAAEAREAAVRPVVEAAIMRAQVLRDRDHYGSGSQGWYDRERDSDRAIRAAVDALPAAEEVTEPPLPQDFPRCSLDLTGRTDEVDDPTWGVTFAILDGGERHAYGDQSWVAYGGAIRDSHPNGKVQCRRISISYGPWQDWPAVVPAPLIGADVPVSPQPEGNDQP